MIATQPFTFFEKGQKFVLMWVIVDPDSDQTDHFALESNGAASTSLMYLAPTFKMVDTEVQIFDAYVYINDEEVHSGSQFEWRAGTFSHMIAEKIQDQQVKKVEMYSIKHSSAVTSEALSVISKLNKPDTGFEKVDLVFVKLDEKISDTVVDQFSQHVKHLQYL